MPGPVIEGVWACAYRMLYGAAQSCEVTFGIFDDAVEDPAILAGDLIEAADDNLTSVVNPALIGQQVVVQKLDGTSAEFVQPWETFEGELNGDPLPSQVAMVVTERTALAGRSHRGRMYWPGGTSNAVGTGSYLWDGTYRANFDTAIASWWNQLTSNAHELHVISRLLEESTIVNGLEARFQIGTQRRRLTGGIIF